jgi:hypothetical protein
VHLAALNLIRIANAPEPQPKPAGALRVKTEDDDLDDKEKMYAKSSYAHHIIVFLLRCSAQLRATCIENLKAAFTIDQTIPLGVLELGKNMFCSGLGFLLKFDMQVTLQLIISSLIGTAWCQLQQTPLLQLLLRLAAERYSGIASLSVIYWLPLIHFADRLV